MKILGISCFYHDSAASLIVDGEIIAAAQEERFTRNKHTPDFPINSILFCLEQGGYKINELDSVVFYDKPIVKFERLLSTFYAVSPKGLLPFLRKSLMILAGLPAATFRLGITISALTKLNAPMILFSPI